MKAVVFSSKQYEQDQFSKIQCAHEFKFIPDCLSMETCILAKGYDIVCCFVTDCLNADVIKQLSQLGIKAIVLRSAGYDHVDLNKAKSCDLPVMRVPGYSPSAIAEFAVGLILALSRKILQGHERVKEHNFSLEGLAGFNIKGKTVGIIGTGQIGTEFAKIMTGFSCTIIANDIVESRECKSLGIQYLSKEELYQRCDILSLHCPLNDSTRHLIDESAFKQMKKEVILINTGRGGLIDTKALITALENRTIGAVGIDVYEKEKGLFFCDHTNDIIKDADYTQLESFGNVLITGHQAFLSIEAIHNIVQTTIDNITAFEQGKIINQVLG